MRPKFHLLIAVLVAFIWVNLPMSALAQESTSWSESAKQGQTGIFAVEPGSSLYDANVSRVILVGLMSQDMHLRHCGVGAPFASLQVSGSVEKLLKDATSGALYTHVGVVATLVEGTTYVVEDNLINVLDIQFNGYCDKEPPDHVFDWGPLHKLVNKLPAQYGLGECWPLRQGHRTSVRQLNPQRMFQAWFDAHEGYQTFVQGDEVDNGMLQDLDRVIFEAPGCPKGEANFIVLPIAECKACYRVYSPFQLTGKEDATYNWRTRQHMIYLPTIGGNVELGPPDSVLNYDTQDAGPDQQPIALTAVYGGHRNVDLAQFGSTVMVTDDGGTIQKDSGEQPGDRLFLLGGDKGDVVEVLSSPNHMSQGRGAANGFMALASNSNAAHDLTLVTENGDTYFIVYRNGPRRFCLDCAVVAGRKLNDEKYTFYAGTDSSQWPALKTGGPYGFAKFELNVLTREVRELGFFATQEPVYEATQSFRPGEWGINIVLESGITQSLEGNTFLPLGPNGSPISSPGQDRPVVDEPQFWPNRGSRLHVTMSTEGRYQITNGTTGWINVQDIWTRAPGWEVKIPTDVLRSGGVAVNHCDGLWKGHIVVNGGNKVAVLKPNANWTSLELVGEYQLPPPEPIIIGDGPQAGAGWMCLGGNDRFVIQVNRVIGGVHAQFAQFWIATDGIIRLVGPYNLTGSNETAGNDVVQWENPHWIPEPATPAPTNTPVPATTTPRPTRTPTNTPEPPTPGPSPTATPASNICHEVLDGKVPEAAISAALANPANVYGWGIYCNPGVPPSPVNVLRQWLSLLDPGKLWSQSNPLVYKCGCP